MLAKDSNRFGWFVVFCLFVAAVAMTAITGFVPTPKSRSSQSASVSSPPAATAKATPAPVQLADANVLPLRHETAKPVMPSIEQAVEKPSTDEAAAEVPSTNEQVKSKPEPKSKHREVRSETVARMKWHTDYVAARREAEQKDRMLLINFLPEGDSDAQSELEKKIAADLKLRDALRSVVLARLPVAAKVEVEGKKQPLLKQPGYEEFRGKAGIAMLDFKHEDKPYFGDVVTVLPFANGKYYRWKPSHLKAALHLPAGTITQRTMIWAVRIHPESPASTKGEFHPVLAEAAKDHSTYQAKVGVQGHQNFMARYNQIRAAADAGTGSEVVAESWQNQGMIDSCLDCVRSWRYSPGHWGAVRREHDKYGYDIRKSRRGIWYGTGIFAD
jgi:hypothetical protein